MKHDNHAQEVDIWHVNLQTELKQVININQCSRPLFGQGKTHLVLNFTGVVNLLLLFRYHVNELQFKFLV